MFNCSHQFLWTSDYCEYISPKPTGALHLFEFLSPGKKYKYWEGGFILIAFPPPLKCCLANLPVWVSHFILLPVVPPADRLLLRSVWILLHLSCITDACFVCQLVERLHSYFWYSTNLPFFSFSSSFSSPFLVFPSLRRCCRASLQPTWAKPPAF